MNPGTVLDIAACLDCDQVFALVRSGLHSFTTSSLTKHPCWIRRNTIPESDTSGSDTRILNSGNGASGIELNSREIKCFIKRYRPSVVALQCGADSLTKIELVYLIFLQKDMEKLLNV